jgi:hypothetical protein
LEGRKRVPMINNLQRKTDQSIERVSLRSRLQVIRKGRDDGASILSFFLPH